MAGEQSTDQRPAGRPFVDVTNTFADLPTNLLRRSLESDVFNDRRCQAMDDGCQWRPVSLDQRRSESASCSLLCDAVDNSATDCVDDQFRKDDSASALNRSHSSEHSTVQVATLNDLVADSSEPGPTLVSVDSPAENRSNVSREHPSSQAFIDENHQVHFCSRDSANTPDAASAASVAMATADALEQLDAPPLVNI